MKSLTLIYACYKPNTAPTNRLLSFLKGFDDLGVMVDIVFLYSNNKGDKFDSSGFKNIKAHHLWEKRHSRNKWIKYICSFIDASRFAKSLAPQSRVLLMGSSEYLSYFTLRNDISVYQERSEHFNVARLRPAFLQKRYLNTISKLKGIFVISTALKEAFAGIGAKNVSVVNMTVDANRFSGLEKKESKDKYIAYCGSASNNKDGVNDLIKAFAIVHRSHPDIKLIIIGKAPAKEDSAGNLSLVEDLGLTSSVVFKGIIPAADIPQILVNAEIAALARPDSLQARCGFPTKLGEYLLSGNPVVVTRVGDIPLFLEDGKTAFLSDERDPQGFAEKLLWALDHKEEAKSIGQNGREVAIRHFNYKTETEKMIRTIFPD